MAQKTKHYIPPESNMTEFTFRAVVLGVIMAVVLGAANAYLGLKAGMTVAATFPAAVIAMAVLRIFKGSILEENIARTTGAVGEALAAGAIFTIPAFLIAEVWTDFNYILATSLMLIGGVLGVLFVILLRRTFMEDTSLPFPESVACTEIVKAGQKGATGAATVFGSMGIAAAIEFLKNPNGIPIIGEKIKGIFTLGKGAFPYQSPVSSPAFLGVGFIIGPRLAAITFAGGVFGWFFLMPLVLLIKSMGDEAFSQHIHDIILGSDPSQIDSLFGEFKTFYGDTIKKAAIGAMIVGAFNTLYKMRSNLFAGISRSIKNISSGGSKQAEEIRTEKDINMKTVLFTIVIVLVAMLGVYFWLSQSFKISLIATIVMAIAGFMFAAVAGYLVSIIGSSSNPISGLTLSTLLIAAGLLAILGMTGKEGILAVLGVATVVCCVAGVAGDMIQDWKVGHFLGGTPWKMELGGLIGVVAAAFVLVLPIMLLHKFGGGIGSDALPAPQAGLMATMAQGIIGGQLEWSLILIGVFFAIALILIGSPSPMLIAVGMYLPFETTTAIFVGGVIKWILDKIVAKKKADEKMKESVENRGLLVASGLVAGEALCGIILAGLVASNIKIMVEPGELANYLQQGTKVLALVPSWFNEPILGFLVIIGLGYLMINESLQAFKQPVASCEEKMKEKEEEHKEEEAKPEEVEKKEESKEDSKDSDDDSGTKE